MQMPVEFLTDMTSKYLLISTWFENISEIMLIKRKYLHQEMFMYYSELQIKIH